MITIKWSPVRMDREQPAVSYVAPNLTVDGVAYDLSMVPDGATVEHEVLKFVERSGDDYEVTMILPHGPNAPESTRFPVPTVITEDGVVIVPAYDEVA